MRSLSFGAAALALTVFSSPAFAANDDINALRADIAAMRGAYEQRIAELETKLARLEQAKPESVEAPSTPQPSVTAAKKVAGNAFNPSIGVILNGKATSYSRDGADIAGFAAGEEGERGTEGLSLDESELHFSANADDMFMGNLTAAIVNEDGEDGLELEEAYLKTLPGSSLPDGMSVKAGRALWQLGYLNSVHAHADDFADRPLPYRVFLNQAFNDDGAEVTYILPTDMYTEIGGGVFRGDDFPGGSAKGENPGAYTLFARIGGDVGDNQSWRFGLSTLQHNKVNRLGADDSVLFAGDSGLYVADMRYSWAPTGNAKNQEVLLQGEYFVRDEHGNYEDIATGSGAVPFDETQSGWYAQGVYKFLPQWRVGARYTALDGGDVPAGLFGTTLDAAGHDPYITSLMGDYTHSEFSRVRLQYNNDNASATTDHQFILQYVISLGAHPAHSF